MVLDPLKQQRSGAEGKICETGSEDWGWGVLGIYRDCSSFLVQKERVLLPVQVFFSFLFSFFFFFFFFLKKLLDL